MKFCRLNNDSKTFHLIKSYMAHLEQSPESCMVLDNRIQAEEIHRHLENQRINDTDRQMEILHWVEQYSQSFRIYLNTLKIAALILLGKGCSSDSVNWQHYQDVESELNRYKSNCLDSIF